MSSNSLVSSVHVPHDSKTVAPHSAHSLLQFVSRRRRVPVNPYWLAVLSALFGFVLRLAVDNWLGNQMPYITFLVAVALVGLFAGVGPALVSTVLGAGIAYFCFVPPRYAWGFEGVSDAAGFFSYLAAALGIVLLTATRTRAHAQAERRLQEQLEAQAKLRDAEKLFELFMEHRPGFSYLRERSGRYVYFNQAARRVLGLENPGAKLPQVVAELEEQDEQAFSSSTPRQFINKVDLPTGERYWLTTKFTFFNEQQQPFVGSVSADITEQVKAEELAVKKERLMAATQMLAMVSHELNNPLAAVTNSVYLLGKEPLAGRAKELAGVAQLELTRLAHVTRLVLGFYKDNERSSALDPRGLIGDLVEKLNVQFGQAKPRVSCDFSWHGTLELPFRQTQEVLNNLLRNAFESNATRIRIRVRKSLDWRSGLRSGCRISILDDGHGMTTEQQKRAFEPFFSTKTQKGCGLGLFVTKAIVLKNSWLMSLYSTDHSSRHSTCVSVLLPARVYRVDAPTAELRKALRSASRS